MELNRGDGAGNFFLKPNGVFYVSDGRAHLCETSEFANVVGDRVQLATQSGPLLLRAGKTHPAFEPASSNRKVRSGVGVSASGEVVFVLSENRVTFHELSSLYRERLGCADALYLDGEISRFYGPDFGWHDGSGDFAAILAIVERPR